MKCLWKTENEGSVPTHAIVLRNGHVFLYYALQGDNSVKSPKEIEADLREIKAQADNQPSGPGVGALTCDKRDAWATNREYLLKLGILAIGSVHLHHLSVNFINLRPDFFVANPHQFWAKLILTYSSTLKYLPIPTIYPFSNLKSMIIIHENCRWTDS